MELAFWLDTLKELIRNHWWSAFFLLVTLTTVLTIMVIMWLIRRRFRKILEEKFREEGELDDLPPLGPQDFEALDLIKTMRREMWELPESELQLSVEALNLRAANVVRNIAAVYHPQVPTPQYEASLIDLLGLVRRVSGRLIRISNIVPFKLLGNRKISEYQRYYMVYRRINESPVASFLKRNPVLFRMTRWAINIKNLGNPIYWAGRELSRESYFMMLRWFYLTFVSQVGREAMRVYSGRHFQRDEDRDLVLVCYRLFALVSHWGGPSSSEWSLLVSHVSGQSSLEDETKVHVLSRLAEGKLPKDLHAAEIKTKAGLRWYKEGLSLLLKGERKPSPAKVKMLKEELAMVKKAASEGSAPRTDAQES